MTTRTVSIELTTAQRQAFEEAVERQKASMLADIVQALTDPENQPSQFGTLPTSLMDGFREALEQIANSDDVDNALDPEANKRIAIAALAASPKPTDTAEKEVGDG